METEVRVQTAFRLSTDLIFQLKRRAKEEHRSLNSYVEDVLEREVNLEIPKLPKDFKVSETVRKLAVCSSVPKEYLKTTPEEQSRIDDRMKWEYLKEKYGL